MSSVEERVSRLERSMARARLFSTLKIAFYIIVIVGVALYLYGLYQSRGEWRADLYEIPQAGVKTYRTLHLRVPLEIYNPNGDVLAKLVYYRIYIEGEYAGDGFIPYLSLPSGTSQHMIEVDIDLARAGCGVAKALSTKDNITVRVQGYAMVDLKTFGGITWKTITVPFNVTAKDVRAPELDDKTRAFLQVVVLLCEQPEQVIDILEAAGQIPSFPSLQTGTGTSTGDTGTGGGEASLPSTGGSGGGESQTGTGETPTEGSLSVRLEYWDAGFGRREVVVVVESTLGVEATVYSVRVNGEVAVTGQYVVPPGGSVEIRTGRVLPIGAPVVVEVETSVGTLSATGVVS